MISADILKKLPPGRHGDGKGLYLQVKGESAVWVFRYTIGGREKWAGIGPYPRISLSKARDKAVVMRAAVLNNRDPRPLVVGQTRQNVTFEMAAREMVEARGRGWTGRYRRDWLASMSTHVFPKIGKDTVKDLSVLDVLKVLRGMPEGSPVLDRAVRLRLSTVLDYAIAMGWRTHANPALWNGHLEHLLPRARHTVKHHPAIPWREVPALMTHLGSMAAPAAQLLRFIMLTACRTGEARLGNMLEVDATARIWTIPKERTKTSKNHRVPLSNAAMGCLGYALAGRGAMFSTGHSLEAKPLHPSTVLYALKRTPFAQYTVHGFRSAFRDWVTDTTSYPRELAEIALGHEVYGKTERSYARSDMLERRREMMEDWGKFCCPEFYSPLAQENAP